VGGAGALGGTETTETSRVTVRTADAGYGLTGMRERLRILDGTLAAGYDDGCWVVAAHLPLPRPTGKMTA
jgi:glucose-6-phosphate-specific signal transduction histidine kinase